MRCRCYISHISSVYTLLPFDHPLFSRRFPSASSSTAKLRKKCCLMWLVTCPCATPQHSRNSPRHRDDFDIANTQSDEESPPSLWLVNSLHRLPPSYTSITQRSTYLHPPSDYLKRITRCLTDRPGDRTASQIACGCVITKVRNIICSVPLQSTVCEERNARIRDHAEDGHWETSVKGVQREVAYERGDGLWLFLVYRYFCLVINGFNHLKKGSSFWCLCLVGQTDTDEL